MSPSISKVLLTLIALTLLRAGSCVQIQRPYAPPTAAQVLAAIKARALRVGTLRGEARMSYRTDQGRIKATVRMMTRKGGELRFDVVSPFDTPLATLICSKGHFALVDSRKGRYFHGPASPCNLARLLQVALRPEDINAVLSGGTPLIDSQHASLAWDSRAGCEVLTLKSKDAEQIIRLDGRDKRWRLLSSEIRDAKGQLLLKIVPSAFTWKKGIEMPGKIVVEQPLTDASLQLEFKRIEVGIKLPEVAFERPAPKGLVSQYVDCATLVRHPSSAPSSPSSAPSSPSSARP
ncbi:MAG: DUF4292 domain-containing protein [Deltaproteobacteria bacterium]|nr:DUF4292 domain-containing protein [Deltaproteobacteria bacterium]